MPFVYDVYLNGKQQKNVEIGFTTTRKWEEALDEAKLSLAFLTTKEPNKMFGFLNINIYEIDNHEDKNILNNKSYEMFIINDSVEPSGSYGYFKHNLNAIEYTSKLDNYMLSGLVHSLSLHQKGQAPFEITSIEQIINNVDQNSAQIFVHLDNLNVNKTYYTSDIVALKVSNPAFQATTKWTNSYEYSLRPIYVETNAPLVQGNQKVWLTNDSIPIFTTNWKFPKGQWEIKYGFKAEDLDPLALGDPLPDGDYWVYKFFIEVIEKEEETLYHLLDKVRSLVGKYGGLESTKYFDETRIFDIDEEDANFLKTIKTPQVFLETATVRQVLLFLLSYVNALPRLRKGEERDVLGLEYFGEVQGSYETKDVISISGSQNINQIGTNSYTKFKQAMPNDLETPTTYAPSKNAYQKVRAVGTQLTDSSFEFKLPENKPLYKPIKFKTKVDIEYSFDADMGINNIGVLNYNLELDLTDRLINRLDWETREITGDVVDITKLPFWDKYLGLRPNRVSNLSWDIGDTSIKLSDVYGNIFQTALIFNVIREATFEHFMLNVPFETYVDFIDDEYKTLFYPQVSINITSPKLDDSNSYKDLEFNLEYISLEDIVVKQEKEDLTQVDFYSDLRQNQDESIINIVRGSRKNFGVLQRVGNKKYSFSKIYFSLDKVYNIGTRDINDFTITDINTEYHNDYIIVEYFITKHFNRIQEATFVDQTYRWRDNYSKNVMDRHDHYRDYLIVSQLYEDISDQKTLIPSNKKYDIQKILFSKIGGIDLGDLKGKTKATVVGVKTSGMLEYYGGNKMIITPLTSFGMKQALVFTFGFTNNQIVGDKIIDIQKGGSTLQFNSPVRYTNKYGKFRNLSFVIANEMDDDFVKNDYPLLDYSVLDSKNKYFNTFSDTDTISYLNLGTNPLIVLKDALTNFTLSYQLSIISYKVNEYVLGLSFYTENPLIKNDDIVEKTYLYTYNNKDYYNSFEDLYIKDNYVGKIELVEHSNLSFSGEEFIVDEPRLANLSHWAIGTNDGKLLIACNNPNNQVFPYSFKINEFHHRPNIKEIGYVEE